MSKLRQNIARGVFLAVMSFMLTDASTAVAADINFKGWTHQKFGFFGGNDWQQSDDELTVEADRSVSLLWRALPADLWQTSSATWTWRVDQSVPQTDLSLKGGDDRNFSLYFIFAPQTVAIRADQTGILGLLDNPDVRVLMYVWGGRHSRGDFVESPYLGARGKTVILRPAGLGTHEETVDFREDLQRVFGQSDLALIGLAVSADSDDTQSRIIAHMKDLRILEQPG